LLWFSFHRLRYLQTILSLRRFRVPRRDWRNDIELFVKMSTAPSSAPSVFLRIARIKTVGEVVDRMIGKLRLSETPDRMILRKRYGKDGMLGPPLDAAMQASELSHRDHLVMETMCELSNHLFK
jgi:hypothetical protein